MARRRAAYASAQALLEQTAAEVAALPGPALRAMGPVLFQAEQELARDLSRWLRTVTDGEARFTAQAYRVALVQIRQALRTARGLNPALFNVLGAAGGDAGRLALGHLARQAEQFSMLFEGSLRPMALKSAAVLAEGRRALIPQHRASALRYGEYVTRDIQRELAVGVARGETFDQLTRRLMRHGGPKGQVTLRGIEGEPGAVGEHIAEGLFRRYRSRAETVVRTETINAYNVVAEDGLREAHAEDEGYLKRWDAAIDGRLCPLCRALDGKTAEVDGVFPGGYRHPPLHPRCRCALTPWHRAWGTSVTSFRPVALKPPAPAPGLPTAAPKPPAPPPPPPAPPKPPGGGGASPKAARVIEAASKFTGAPMLAPLQAELREALNDVVEAEGIRVLPDAAGGRSRNRAISVLPARQLGARGAMDIVNGQMEISTEVMEGAARGIGHDLRTLVHETVHWYSPIAPGLYRGLGRIVEEVTTEVSARSIMRTQFAMKVPAESYQDWIDAVRLRIMRVGNMTSEEAYKALERGSLKLRQSPPPKAIRDPREYAELWARHVFPAAPAKQRELVDAIQGLVR